MLCTIAARILRGLRVEDMLARHGGDEFVVLSVGSTSPGATQLADRVRRDVEGLRISARGGEVPITVTIGFASLSEVEAADSFGNTLLALAKARMSAAHAKAAALRRLTARPHGMTVGFTGFRT